MLHKLTNRRQFRPKCNVDVKYFSLSILMPSPACFMVRKRLKTSHNILHSLPVYSTLYGLTDGPDQGLNMEDTMTTSLSPSKASKSCAPVDKGRPIARWAEAFAMQSGTYGRSWSRNGTGPSPDVDRSGQANYESSRPFIIIFISNLLLIYIVWIRDSS